MLSKSESIIHVHIINVVMLSPPRKSNQLCTSHIIWMGSRPKVVNVDVTKDR